MSRLRHKDCFKCVDQQDILYRCRHDKLKNWVFICEHCLKRIKNSFKDTYQYRVLERVKRNKILLCATVY